MQAAANEKHPAKDKKKDGPKAKGKAKKKGKKRSTSFSDEHLFDIVYRASLEALRTGPSSDNVPPGGTRNVTIELPGGVRLVLSGLDESTSDKTIEGYKRVFLAAYRSVRG
jgi:hypothetical protein